MKIDLGLPAAGNPIEQGRLGLVLVQQGRQARVDRLLLVIQGQQGLELLGRRDLMAKDLPLL